MNTILVEVERRADGKRYPVRCLSPAERARARVLAHRLVHRDRLTVRAAQRAMAEQHGLRRSGNAPANSRVTLPAACGGPLACENAPDSR